MENGRVKISLLQEAIGQKLLHVVTGWNEDVMLFVFENCTCQLAADCGEYSQSIEEMRGFEFSDYKSPDLIAAGLVDQQWINQKIAENQAKYREETEQRERAEYERLKQKFEGDA